MKLRNFNSGPRARSPAPGKAAPEVDDLEEIKVEIAVLKKISRHPYFVNLVEFLNGENDDSVYMGKLIFFGSLVLSAPLDTDHLLFVGYQCLIYAKKGPS